MHQSRRNMSSPRLILTFYIIQSFTHSMTLLHLCHFFSLQRVLLRLNTINHSSDNLLATVIHLMSSDYLSTCTYAFFESSSSSSSRFSLLLFPSVLSFCSFFLSFFAPNLTTSTVDYFCLNFLFDIYLF
jgi:hypothetical protein